MPSTVLSTHVCLYININELHGLLIRLTWGLHDDPKVMQQGSGRAGIQNLAV